MATPTQLDAIDFIGKKVAGRALERPDHEVKTFRVYSEGPRVFVLIETGLEGDEGTMASVFGRSRRFFSIGKRGAIQEYDYTEGTWRKAIII